VDNTVAEGMLKKLTGTAQHIPLLKQIHQLMVKHDIKLRVKHISSKDNILSDALSRGDTPLFEKELGVWSVETHSPWSFEGVSIKDEVFQDLNSSYGPFNTQAACNEWGSNASTMSWWSTQQSKDLSWAGLNVLCVPHDGECENLIQWALTCKEGCPMGSSALFIVKVDTQALWWKWVLGPSPKLIIVRRWGCASEVLDSSSDVVLSGGVPIVALWLHGGLTPSS
jgi:hypothetical protein